MYETLTDYHCCTIYFSIRKQSSEIIYRPFGGHLKSLHAIKMKEFKYRARSIMSGAVRHTQLLLQQ